MLEERSVRAASSSLCRVRRASTFTSSTPARAWRACASETTCRTSRRTSPASSSARRRCSRPPCARRPSRPSARASRCGCAAAAASRAKLGSLSQLKAEQYLTDPRAGIAEFYGRGDAHGPAGTLSARGVAEAPPPGVQSAWFAVYRPCSRDSIAKMLGRVGTGKGLNIKGKSAKKNRLSGFVPFCQISQPSDKAALEAVAGRRARPHLLQGARARARWRSRRSRAALVELQVEKGAKLPIDRRAGGAARRRVRAGRHGLDVPELLLMEVYIRASRRLARRSAGRRGARRSPPSST